MEYSMKCSCGDEMKLEAATRADAVTEFKNKMSVETIASHFAEKHAGQAVPSVEEVHAGIEASVEPKE